MEDAGRNFEDRFQQHRCLRVPAAATGSLPPAPVILLVAASVCIGLPFFRHLLWNASPSGPGNASLTYPRSCAGPRNPVPIAILHRDQLP